MSRIGVARMRCASRLHRIYRCARMGLRQAVLWAMVWGMLLPAPAVAEAPAAAAGAYGAESFTLTNGLTVVVVSNPRVPVVLHMVWYKVGAADDPDGRTGIAHFLEHLMFKGTEMVPAGAFSRAIARIGGRDNAFTSWDYTAYHQTVAAEHLEQVMQMEADRMANLRLDPATVLPEREVVLEERRQRTGNDPRDRLSQPLFAAHYFRHPYGIPVLGWEEDIRGLTRADALAQYQRWYAPNNAILIVVGAATRAQVQALAERYYGPIPARTVAGHNRPREPEMAVERRIVLRDAEVRQPALRRIYRAPHHFSAQRAQVPAVQVLANILAGGATSRLNRTLVVAQKRATTVWLNYNPSLRDYGHINLGAIPAPDVTTESLEAALDQELQTLVRDGVSAEEVAAAQRRLRAEHAYSRDSLTGPAYAIGTALALGRALADVEAEPERLEAVTPDEVNRAARDIFTRRDTTTGLLLSGGGGS